MNLWHRFHRARWFVRVPLKLLAFLVVLAVVLYPHPFLFVTWLQRIQNMNSVLDPSHPGLEPFVEEVRAKLPPDPPPRQVLDAVQQVVLRRVPYAWDWDTWGVMDYIPTVDEVLRMGREDCDGRAVVAASVLRRMNYDATIVSDVLHVWVETPYGPTMNPTSAEHTLVGGEGGTKVSITPGLIRNLGRGMSYGVGAFPLPREVILVATICLLSAQPRSGIPRRLLGCILLATALAVVRLAGIDAAMRSGAANVTQVVIGFALAAAGWMLLVIRAGSSSPRCDAAHPE